MGDGRKSEAETDQVAAEAKVPSRPFLSFCSFPSFSSTCWRWQKKRGARGEGKKLPFLPFLQAFFHPFPYRHYPLPPPHTLRLFAFCCCNSFTPTFFLLPAGVAQAIRPLPALLAATTRQRRQQQRTGRRRKGERRRRRWRWKERGNERRRGGCAKKREKPPPPLSPGAHFPRVPLLLLLCTTLTNDCYGGGGGAAHWQSMAWLPPPFFLLLLFFHQLFLSISSSLPPPLPSHSDRARKWRSSPSPSPFPKCFAFLPPPFFLTYPFRLSSTTTSLLFSASITAFFCANMCPRSFLSPPFSDRCRVPFSSFSLLILLLLPPTFQFWKGKKSREGKARPREERQRERGKNTRENPLSPAFLESHPCER